MMTHVISLSIIHHYVTDTSGPLVLQILGTVNMSTDCSIITLLEYAPIRGFSPTAIKELAHLPSLTCSRHLNIIPKIPPNHYNPDIIIILAMF